MDKIAGKGKRKIAIVTGASLGLGKAIALELASQDHVVIMVSRNKGNLQKAKKEILNQVPNAVLDIRPCDITKPQQLDNLVQKLISIYGRIDVLINNAAIWYEGDLEGHPDKKLQELFEVNVLGQLYITKRILPIMKKQNVGDIIFVNSIAATHEFPEGYAPYAATKFAIKGFAESIRPKYAKYNIRIMQIYPPGMATEIFKRAGFNYGRAEWMTDPANVAKIIIFMLNTPRDITLGNVVVNKTGFN